MTHQIDIEEEDRQVILLALAHLAVERPGWDNYLRTVAAKMDDDHLSLYHGFKSTAVPPVQTKLVTSIPGPGVAPGQGQKPADDAM